MICLALSRKTKLKTGIIATEYMIANGDFMGKWTINFGVHCLADTSDCKGFLKLKHKEFSETKLETYQLNKLF